MESSHQETHSPFWMTGMLVAAGVYNLLWGGAVILFPGAIFRFVGMEPPLYPEIWQCVGMIVGVYGVGYLVASTAPLRHWPMTLVGLLGKILGPIGFAAAVMRGDLPLVFGITIVTNDLLWWVPFAAILYKAFQRREISHGGLSAAGSKRRSSHLDSIHHVAVAVDDVSRSVAWYAGRFHCRTAYQDETWALIEFGNLSLALVTRGQHPPHVGFISGKDPQPVEWKTHRDGTRFVYVTDPAGNTVELLDSNSLTVPASS